MELELATMKKELLDGSECWHKKTFVAEMLRLESELKKYEAKEKAQGQEEEQEKQEAAKIETELISLKSKKEEDEKRKQELEHHVEEINNQRKGNEVSQI
jgi:uncharacterized membrane protein YcjF (UPF0283 family)